MLDAFHRCSRDTSEVSSMYVMFVLTPNGHWTLMLSLFSCSKKTIRTKRAFIIKKAKTDLFLSSLRSVAILAWKQRIKTPKKMYNTEINGLRLGTLGFAVAKRRPNQSHLLGHFIISNICLDSEGPFEMQKFLVQLEEEYNEDEQSVDHEKGKH